MLTIKNLNKVYRKHNEDVKALDDLSLHVKKGDFVTVTGPSGSGKTTLLLTIGGLIKPSSGEMIYEGENIDLHDERRMERFRAEKVAYVMQSFALIPYLTALENVLIAINVSGMDKEAAKNKALQLLEWVGLGNRKSHLPRELSAGQQQRVAIARALANDPSILLADEPTGNLDPALSKEILDVLTKINSEGTTVIMVTHSKEAADYGNIRFHLENGKIKEITEQNKSNN